MAQPQSSTSNRKFSLYSGVSDRPLGWKPRKATKTARDLSVRRWDGAARRSTEWDSLRKDAELWYPNGDCLVHLYGEGQSRRGPAFKVPIEALVAAGCQPLLKRFLLKTLVESPGSEADSEDSCYFRPNHKMHELYIPAPPAAEREQAFLYHTATRNLFAWVFGKPLVGNHLGGALVGLLNSMNEFRSQGEDNVQDIMDYMDEEGYADMRNQPDHALAILFFAEHFQFRDLWIDAFAHCSGMNERLGTSVGFEFITRTSRALVTRSRMEMDMRLDNCGQRLSTFLSDDLSDAHLGLSSAARAHLDKFRSFLQSYYVAKLGYYPPTSCAESSAAFPKSIYRQMCTEFQKLYDYLVDSNFTTNDNIPLSHQGGICVMQSVQAFDQRHKYQPLQHPIPLLPEVEECASLKARPILNKRFSFAPRDKMKPDPRLVAFASMSKATNGSADRSFFDCTLVRAYRGFEKDCVFTPTKADRNDKLSPTDARKVRWILVYAILQTLLSATRVPSQVRDSHNVPYNLSVIIAGCPSWQERPIETLFRTQTDQMLQDFAASKVPLPESTSATPIEIKPDVDYFALNHARKDSNATLSSMDSRKSSVRRALSTLGNMPELRHPKPQRSSYHEILVHGYGNGTNTIITAEPQKYEQVLKPRTSSESGESSSAEGTLSSRWSHTSIEANEELGSATSSSSRSRRGSDSSLTSSKIIKAFLDEPMELPVLARVPSSVYSSSEYDLQPEPLEVKKNPEEEYMKIVTEVKVDWEDCHGNANEELLAYLNAEGLH